MINRCASMLIVMTALGAGCARPAPPPASDRDVIADVRRAIAANDLDRGAAILHAFRSTDGATPEAIEALSWLARGALAAGNLGAAERYASETYTLAVAALKQIALDQEPHLQTALGAAIETGALVAVARGERTEAVSLLRREIETYRDTASTSAWRRTSTS